MIPDLIGKRHFERMEGIVGILHHLGRADRRPNSRRCDTGIDFFNHITLAGLPLADHDLRRMVIVFHRRSLPEELRVVADVIDRFRRVLPECFSRIGMATSSVVPGNVVLRNDHGMRVFLSRRARPISSQTRFIWVRSRLAPFAWLGVPTQMKRHRCYMNSFSRRHRGV